MVALANYEVTVAQRKTNEKQLAIAASEKPLVINELATVKLELAGGGQYSLDQIVQSAVDAIQIPLRLVLEAGEPVGKPVLPSIDWDSVIYDFNLSIMYRHAESLWDECLWNSYEASEEQGAIIFRRSNAEWLARLAISRARHANLVLHFFNQAATLCSQLPSQQLRALAALRCVKAVKKDGRQQTIVLGSQIAQQELTEIVASRLLASEQYYLEILRERQQALHGATLDDLLSASMFLRQIAIVFRDSVKDIVLTNALRDSLPRCVPIVQVDALVHGLASASSLDFQKARSIIEFLTYRGHATQELWSQPLVPTGKGVVSLVFGALLAPNFGRLLDVWMNQLGMDLAIRGPAFEQHVRNELQDSIASSTVLSSAKLLPTHLVFHPPEGWEEEIDLVLVIDDLVIIGEIKCALLPTEAKQIAMHRQTVERAAEQIGRKVSAIEKSRTSFRQALQRAGIDVADDFRVLPLVVMNGQTHVGFSCDGVPMVDLYILRVFLAGELVKVAQADEHGALQTVSKRTLYTDRTGAAAAAATYFRDPPQLDVFRAGLQTNWVPIGAIDERDWRGAFLAFDCFPSLLGAKRELENYSGPSGGTPTHA